MRHAWLVLVLAACGKVTSNSTADAPAAADAAPDAAAGPTISGLAPVRGVVTTAVTLSGAGLGASQGTSTVTFGGVGAVVTSWSDTRIVVSVPDVLPGDADVVVTTGGGASTARTFRVILPPMVYLNNDANDGTGADTITAMSFDPSTGAMATAAAAVSLGVGSSGYGGCSQSIVVHEHTRHLFATGATGVASFQIDPVTGALTPAAGSPFAVGSSGFGLIPSADGTKLFVTSYGTMQIAVFDVAADGVLTPVAGSPFTSNDVDTIATAVNDTFVYANTYQTSFQGFHVDTSGALTAIGAAITPGGVAIATRTAHPQLYVELSTGALGVYAVDLTSGAPTPIAGSPFTLLPGGGLVDAPMFTSDGGRAYFGVEGTPDILGVTLAADGTPTAILGSPWTFSTTIGEMSCLALSSDDTWIIGADEQTNDVGAFRLDGNGAPSPAAGSPFQSGAPVTGASGLAVTF